MTSQLEERDPQKREQAIRNLGFHLLMEQDYQTADRHPSGPIVKEASVGGSKSKSKSKPSTKGGNNFESFSVAVKAR